MPLLARMAKTDQINLRATLECGQVFHWRELPGGAWEGLIGGHHAVVKESRRRLEVVQGDPQMVASYFAIDHDLAAIYEGFPRDETMLAALDFCRGLRIIRQPAWECLATFITSSMKQVAHIRQMSVALRGKFGRAVRGTDLRAYPSPAAIGAASEEDLRSCGLGYRAKNLRATAQRIASGDVDLDELQSRDDAGLRDALCDLPGVGRKVANCAMLFGFGRLAAFPVDTWIERILKRSYWRGRGKPTPLALEKKLSARFGPHAGYAQQYLFHHARTTQGRGG